MWQGIQKRFNKTFVSYRNHTSNYTYPMKHIFSSKLTLIALVIIGLGMIASTDEAKWLFKAFKGGDVFEVVNVSKKENDRYPILHDTNAFRARNVKTGHLVFFAGYEKKLEPGKKFQIRWGQLCML